MQMARKKTSSKKKPKKKSSKSAFLKTQFKKSIAGISLLILLVVITGFLVHRLLLHKQPERPSVKGRINEKVVHIIPPFEIYPKEELPAPGPIIPPKVPAPKKLPKVAIIIDDIGYDRVLAEKFLSLDAMFTFSILPFSPLTKNFARAAREKGYETMLHLPMEPNEYPMVDPGAGLLLTSMSPDELISQLEEDLAAVPFIKGVNNHMGSKMTAVSTQMYQIFSILKKRGLYFVDSKTTPNSLCRPSARLLQIPFAERNVFLDHIHEPEAIRRQIEQLIHIANRRGEALGIAHPNKITYEVIRKMLPDLQKKVQLVPVSEIVHIIG